MEKQYTNSRPAIPAHIKRKIEVEAGHQCTIQNCHEHTYLEIHHINQNREDNRPENLILLCDRHHKMAHANIIDRKSLKEYKKLLNMQMQHSGISFNNNFYNDLTNEFEKRILGIGFDWLKTLPQVDWSLEVETYNELYSLVEWIDSRDWIEDNDIKNNFQTLSKSIKQAIEIFELHMTRPTNGYYFINKFYREVDYNENPKLREKLQDEFDKHTSKLSNKTIEIAINFNNISRLIRQNVNDTFLSNRIIPTLHGRSLV